MLASQRIVKGIQRTLNASSARSIGSVFAPLTDPLEDDAITTEKKPLSGEAQVTKLANGTKVASLDLGGAVSNVQIAVQAGSRFETSGNLGVAHVLKNAAFLSNGGRTQLRQIREAQVMGASLECSASRELITRRCVALRSSLPEVMENMAPGVASPLFQGWEIGHSKSTCVADIASLDCTAKNSEAVHKLAFRNGLGNSLYIDSFKIGGVSAGDVVDFANATHVGNRISVVGTNVDHDELVRYAEELLGGLPSGPALGIPVQKYFGGEARLSTGPALDVPDQTHLGKKVAASHGLAYASLVGPVPGLTSPDFPAVALLQRLLGGPQMIKWGTNSISSRLNSAVGAATTEPYIIESLNIGYSDVGVFGVHAVSSAEAIGAVLDAAVGVAVDIGAGKLTEEDLLRCKNQLKADVLSQETEGVAEDLLKQVAFTGGFVSTEDMLKSVDDVTVDKVVEIANQIMTSNSTYVVTGDTSTAPYLDELV